MRRMILKFLTLLRIIDIFIPIPKGKYCCYGEDNKYICLFFKNWHCKITDCDIIFHRLTKLPLKERDKEYQCPFYGR